MEKFRILEKEGKLSFSNRTELIQFVSSYVSLKYKEHLEFWRATAMDDPKEMLYWEKRIKTEVPKLEKAIKKLLKWRLIFNKNVNINSQSLILKKAFKKAKIKVSPENCFSSVEYEINNLVFTKTYR